MVVREGLLGVAVFCLLVPGACAQAMGDDPGGDQEVGYDFAETTPDHTQWLPPGFQSWYQTADLLKAGIMAESEDTFTVEFLVTSKDAALGEPQDFWSYVYVLNFTFHAEPRRVMLTFVKTADFEMAWAFLQHREGEEWVYDAFAEVEDAPEGIGWRATFLKFDLRDSRYVPVKAGDRLTGLSARAGLDEDAEAGAAIAGWDEAEKFHVEVGQVPTAAPTAAAPRWSIDLRPGLAMGLDFDTSKPIAVKLNLGAPADFTGTAQVVLNHVVYTQGANTVTRIARGEATAQAFTADQAKTVEISLQLEAAADRIPFVGSSSLDLEVYLNGTYATTPPLPDPQGWMGRGSAQPEFLLYSEGSTLDLPLFDFHDAIPQDVLDSIAALVLDNRTPNYKAVNPGRTAAFAFEVKNAGSKTHTVEWTVSGQNAEWAELYPAASEVRGPGAATVLVRVTPPAGAKEGETADLVLLGRSRQDAGLQVFARMVAGVTSQEDIPDESGVAEEFQKDADKAKKESPGLGLLPVLAGVAAVAFARRRRE